MGESRPSWFVSWMMLSIIVNLVQIFLAAMRWGNITAQCDAPLHLWQSVRYNLIGSFFNQTLPSAIGGDAVRVLLLRRTGVGWRAATYSILVDRAIGLIALAIIVAVSLPWSYQIIGDPHGRLALLTIDLAAVAGGVGFLVFGRLPWRLLQSWWPTRHIHACSVIANRVIFDQRTGYQVLMLSLFIHLLTIATAWCALRAISAPASFEYIFLLVPPVMLITMLPISIAGWGVREATMMLAFAYAGLSRTDGTMVSLLFGASSFLTGAIGGLVWAIGNEKREPTENMTDKLVGLK
jgi:uncharacterized membrane protein YbhN (UPF0104 family)